jgi:hypothetical protein
LQQDYQRFLLLGSRRAPHTVHVHETGYRSGTINTDAQGLRYSHRAGKRFSVAERAAQGASTCWSAAPPRWASAPAPTNIRWRRTCRC